ncbi:MAG: glycosyltransferase family 39 protein [Clostridiaceae bacterium]|nr:glycosyltransferase family 39 protein [Clostridiaceae bacterium]
MSQNIKKKNIYNKFITFVLGSLLILMLFIIASASSELTTYNSRFGVVDIIFIIFSVTFVVGIYFAKKRDISNKKLVIIISIVGLLLRLAYCLTINSVPISDFAVMYETGGSILEGDLSMLWGTGYIARFPHITIPTLYYAVMRGLFSNPMQAIKIVNAIASTCSIFIVYKIVKILFNDKKALIAAVITALYPPLIVYTAVYTTENIAIPLFLAGIYYFILYMKGIKDFKSLILAGILVSVGNLFRMAGIILIAAFVLYSIASFEANIKKKILSIALVILSFVIPLVTVSFTLKYYGVTEYHLWKGREPNITNILKGTNIEYKGRWNLDDASIPEECNFDYDKIQERCKEIIWERLTTTPFSEQFKFLTYKYSSQWCSGDYSGPYWAEHSIENEEMPYKYSEDGEWFGQLFYLILLALSYVGLLNFNKVKKDRMVSLFYYIFCGYSIFYLITENQARYAFTVCWIFVIMAIVGIDFIEKLNFRKDHK